MRNNPKPYEIYEHFKGNKYQILTLAKHSETGEDMVVYQALYGDYAMYVRPLSLFLETMDDGTYRFRKLNEEMIPPKKDIGEHNMTQKSIAKADNNTAKEKAEKQDIEQEDSLQEGFVDPMVMDFLDADTYEERLNILTALHHRITDDMINTMAIAIDVEIEDGAIETRYEELKHCLITFQKYQCNRVR